MNSKSRIPRKFLALTAFGMASGTFPEMLPRLFLGTLAVLAGDVLEENRFDLPGLQPLAASEPAEGEKIRQNISPDSLFLEELLKRGLFRLAELHCRERLAMDSISPAVQTEMTVELIRVLQEKALCAPMPEKKELDAQCRRLYEDFRKTYPECPWLLALDFQYAVGLFAQARRAEMEARFALDPQTGMEEARQRIREAIRLFHEIGVQREKLVLAIAQEGTVGTPSSLAAKKRRSRSSSSKKRSSDAETVQTASRFDENGLSLWELESMRQNLEFQLLLACQLQALTYPEDSLDRINSLKEAQSHARSLTMIPSGSALYWSARIEEIRCLRLVKDLENARDRIEMLDSQRSAMPESIRMELLAEKIRFTLAKEDLALAMETVRTELHADILGVNGELDCAILEFWLAQWSAAMKNGENASDVPASENGTDTGISEKENDAAQKLRDESLEILNTIRAKSAPWWVLRAEILFNGMLKNAGENQNLSFLKLAAENACVNFDPDAVAACERLWKAALSQEETETALHAAEMAGTMLYRNGKKADAVTWFRRMAVTFPEDPNAVQNHSRAAAILAECVSQELRSSGGKLNETLNARLDAYQLLLMEHFQLFGKKDPKFLDWLHQLENVTRIRGNYAECVDVSMILAANTPTDDPSYRKTTDSCFQTWRLYLEMLEKNASSDYPQALFSAIQWSRTLPSSEVHCLETVPFLLRLNRLHAKLEQMPTRDSETCGAETCDAETCDAETCDAETCDAENLERSENFERSEIASKNALQNQIIQKEIQLFDSMRPYLEAFPPEIRDEVEQIGAHALLYSGKHEEAFPFYEKIANKFPNRLEVQLTWGRLLAEKTEMDGTAEERTAEEKNKKTEEKQKALEQWRRIEKHVPDHSSEWFEAKYWIIRLQWELGEEKLAARLLRTLRILHPEFGGKKWKKKFEELEKKMEGT